MISVHLRNSMLEAPNDPFFQRNFPNLQQIHPWKLRCPLKSDHFSREYIFQQSIFRGHVSFQGSIWLIFHDPWIITCLKFHTQTSLSQAKFCWLVVSTHLKHISQNGILPQIGEEHNKQIFDLGNLSHHQKIGMNIKNLPHHLGRYLPWN